MSDIAKRLNQCRKPQGGLGKLVVQDMNESHFQLTSWGLEKVTVNISDTILDIGCGGGRTINRLASKISDGKVYGVDYSKDCVIWAGEFNKNYIEAGKVEIIKASVDDLPFEDNKFNLVTAIETIYFWPDFEKALKEIKRVLKPSGKLLIVNEMYSDERFEERNGEFASIGNMHIYKPSELRAMLEKAGYKNVNIDLIEEKNWLRSVGEI